MLPKTGGSSTVPRFAFDGPLEPLSGMSELARFAFADFEDALGARAAVSGAVASGPEEPPLCFKGGLRRYGARCSDRPSVPRRPAFEGRRSR